MNTSEKVSVICIAFNHEEWIEETLNSVRLQDYYEKELIIVENGSTDQTREKINNWVSQFSGFLQVRTIFKDQSAPYCGVFNEVLFQTDSKYVVDLSGDDVLYPQHLSRSIGEFKRNPEAAFVFSDARMLEPDGDVSTFYKRDSFGKLLNEVELRGIYHTLLRRSYVCSATMVFNSKTLKQEGGYDEALFYEDFDIQLRLARRYPVLFSDHVGIVKRKHASSMSADQYQRYYSKMLPSTVKVCEKALAMNVSKEENEALGERVLYELKHALWSANFEAAGFLVEIGERVDLKGLLFFFFRIWAKKRWDISWIYVKIT